MNYVQYAVIFAVACVIGWLARNAMLLLAASRPARPWLRIQVPPRLARLLRAAGAQGGTEERHHDRPA